MSNKSKRTTKRSYDSRQREEAAAVTRGRVLASAKALFTRRGIDAVTIAELAEKARVSASTVYALFKSKEGVLLALMEGAMFGDAYRLAVKRLDGVTDPVKRIANTSSISRAVYDGESAELGLMRGASAFSPALRRMEQTFEDMRYALQEERLKKLYAEGHAKKGLAFEEARRLMWMYTSRDVYRMLVQEGGWAPDRYEAWLSQTLIDALVARKFDEED
ncbi:MAG: helix-turn-helix domain-containing protein [Hyphomonadaceae bacterium]|nr:helix-turn-helix domain-containing protein [Hyphomonadaceae bacterium]